jgi:hypothetical protein
LRGLRQVWADVRAPLGPVLTAMRALAGTDPIAHRWDHRPGVGPGFSLTVRAEIGTIARFPDGRHLASDAGLVPPVAHSGSRPRNGPITKPGSAGWRWALLEVAIHQFRRPDDVGRWARPLRRSLSASTVGSRLVCLDSTSRFMNGSSCSLRESSAPS